MSRAPTLQELGQSGSAFSNASVTFLAETWQEVVLQGRRAVGPSWTPLIVAAALTFVVLAIGTRIVTGSWAVKPRPASSDGVQIIPAVPYWLPILGHIPNMAFGADSFLSELRARFRPTGGIFALNFGGTRHNILTTPALAAALFSQKSSHVDAEQITFGLMRNIFGFPGREARQYEEALPELMACYKHLTTEPHLSALAAAVAQDLQREAANLVTFNESPVDQMAWERAADVELRTTALGEPVVEASLLPLVRDFCAHLANRALFGADLLANCPDLLADMWILDNGFFLLATGLPRFVPIPALTRAHLARRRLLQHFDVYHAALAAHFEPDGAGAGRTVDAKWSGLPGDVGALIRSRLPVYAKHDLTLRARAACELALLWAANANSHTLVFWMLNHIYADRELLAIIREEIAPYVDVAAPERHAGMPIAEPARITRIDRDGLCGKCPHLKSIYIECLRLDTASWSLKVVKQDAVLVSRGEKGAGGGAAAQQQQSWQLRKGDYVHAAHDLHNTDPVYFPDPTEWRSDRHVKVDPETGAATAEIGSIRPYGGGTSMCKGRQLALQEVLIFTAGIVAMWDIAPAKGGVWKMPKHKRATGVYTSDEETRVWVQPRKL